MYLNTNDTDSLRKVSTDYFYFQWKICEYFHYDLVLESLIFRYFSTFVFTYFLTIIVETNHINVSRH